MDDTRAGRTRRVAATAAAGLVVAIVIGLAWADRARVGDGLSLLRTADPRWLGLAAVAAAGLWLAGALAQVGALGDRVPFGRLCAVQIAASFADHLLPGGAGGMTVNGRFLRRHGLSRSAATSAVLLRTAAGWCAHVVLFAALVLSSPTDLKMAELHSGWSPPWLLVLAGLGTGAVVALGLRRWSRRRDRRPAWITATELRAGLTVLRRPRRAAALWTGACAVPLLHSLVLWAVARSLHVELGAERMVLLYLVVSALSGLVPAPGAIGALDVALVAALMAAGVPGVSATGATIAYRLFTVWAPLLPAGALLAMLVHRDVV
ncbi:MAG TPA: lysylphosphatidylglycerol synthase transmembrane domain-containing protein [Sporichthyaceae bacterium]|nr:lysylphosphatidylglycerol synthase transmembrane domain-containing protein [Sporichthyaceae bacterium]